MLGVPLPGTPAELALGHGHLRAWSRSDALQGTTTTSRDPMIRRSDQERGWYTQALAAILKEFNAASSFDADVGRLLEQG